MDTRYYDYEISITTSRTWSKAKSIHYIHHDRMSLLHSCFIVGPLKSKNHSFFNHSITSIHFKAMKETKFFKYCRLLIILMVNFLFLNGARSEVYTVGDEEEWNADADFVSWSQKYKFSVGDVLRMYFSFNIIMHALSVLLLFFFQGLCNFFNWICCLIWLFHACLNEKNVQLSFTNLLLEIFLLYLI